jgi:hypothetical protein
MPLIRPYFGSGFFLSDSSSLTILSKIALEEPALHNAVFIKLAFRMNSGDHCRYFATVLENLAFGEFQKSIEPPGSKRNKLGFSIWLLVSYLSAVAGGDFEVAIGEAECWDRVQAYLEELNRYHDDQNDTVAKE